MHGGCTVVALWLQVRDAVEAVLQRVRTHVQADKELAAAEKEMQKVLKRMTSKK